jgi:ferredoxin-NADP reductase/ferredoxin
VKDRKRDGAFRDLRVTAKVVESRIITSFHLEPVEPEGWTPFAAGQFLVLRVPPKGARRAMPRSYSVSSSPSDIGRYRITVKRETSPGPGIPDGAGSCWLHDEIGVGDVISAAGPRGEFVLDTRSRKPVALLSGGVGLTPMIAMLHALSDPAETRPVHFIHACDSGDVHALREEVLGLARRRPGIAVHFCYRFPTERDLRERPHHSEGVVTRELLDRLLPHPDCDHYLCGPPPFMKAVYGLLRGRGVPKEQIAYEFFGPATVLEADVQAADAPLSAPDSGADGTTQAEPQAAAPAGPPPSGRDWLTLPASPASGHRVEFRKSGKAASWDDSADSLLAFAEAQGLMPDFSCRSGVCGTCRTALVAGEVTYTSDPLDPPGDGEVLICCAKPKGDIVLDL